MQKIIFWLVLLTILFFFIFPPYRVSYSAPIEPELPPIKEYAEKRVYEVFGGQWLEFEQIISRESANWTVTTEHYPVSKKSTAYGLGGFLDATWDDVGCIKTSNEYVQIDCTIEYVKQRYGTPYKALSHHLKKNWY